MVLCILTNGPEDIDDMDSMVTSSCTVLCVLAVSIADSVLSRIGLDLPGWCSSALYLAASATSLG